MSHVRLPILVLTMALTPLAGLPAIEAEAAPPRQGKPPAAASRACMDFYSYANAAWLKAHPRRPGMASVTAMEQLSERARRQQMDLLQESMGAPQGPGQRALGDFWASGLDEAAIERDGIGSIAPLLERIDGIRKPKDVAAAIAALHQTGLPVAFNFAADIDLDDPAHRIGHFSQGGLGLPDPAYYLGTDGESRRLLEQYRDYVQTILGLAGTPADAVAAQARQVIDLETRIAVASRPLHELHDARHNFNRIEAGELSRRYRRLQLYAFLEAQGVTDPVVSIAQPAFFASLDALLGAVQPEDWRAYLRWRVADSMAPYLTSAWRETHFAFRGRTLAGRAPASSRQLAVLDAINAAAGPLLGREYTARHFPGATRARAGEIAANVHKALQAAVETDPRMGEQAREHARAKLARLAIEIGPPQAPQSSDEAPALDRTRFGYSALALARWLHDEEMRRIGRDDASGRLSVLPQQPTLGYDFARNRLIVTAAMLQPPVLDPAANLATQYGAFGALAGRELLHAIDDKGRHVDADGKPNDWWTPGEIRAWDTLGQRVATQYRGYLHPALGEPLDGELVREVAIADQAGLELAWAAYTAAMPRASRTDRQAFFTGWARLWPQRLSREIATGHTVAGYAPGPWRANGPLINHAGFAKAFGCGATSPMQADARQRVVIWPSLVSEK